MGHLNMTNGHSKTQNLVIKESKHLIEITTKKHFSMLKFLYINFQCREHTNNKKRIQNIEVYNLSPEPYFYIEFYQDFTISRGAKNVLRYLPTP